MRYIVKKIGTLIITVLVISFLTFVAFSMIPSDAAINRLGTEATEEQIEQERERLGLNDPLPERYGRWLAGAVKGDFGDSYQYDRVAVKHLISTRLPVTLTIGGLSFLMILLFSIPLSLLCVRKSGGMTDRIITIITQITMAIPSFFLGILITFVFGLLLRLFQPGAYVSLAEDPGKAIGYLLFPAITVALPKIAMTVKFLVSSIRDEMKQDYVKTALSKGNSKARVLWTHVLKNALIPVITFLALIIAEIMAGSIVAEQVFNVPGIGRLLISSIAARDYPVVQAIVIYVTTVVVSVNAIVDILYQWTDPRVRVG